MASTEKFIHITLTENDVPGAKLDTSDFNKYTNIQLKRWLACRGLRQTGKRVELLKRCEDCCHAGKKDNIAITVDNGKWYAVPVAAAASVQGHSHDNQATIPLMPVTGWKSFPSNDIPDMFNYGNIYHYLLESISFVKTTTDGSGYDDDLGHMTAKPLRKGQQYVDSKHVVNTKDNFVKGTYFVKGGVLPSMNSADPHNVHAAISSASGHVMDASCDCKASALGRCSHVGALLLYLLAHVKTNGHRTATCTEKSCEWVKGCKRKNPQDITRTAYHRGHNENRIHIINFDPRPPHLRNNVMPTAEVNNFLSSIRDYNNMWTTLLSYTYEDYELTEERKAQILDLTMQLRTNLNDCGHTMPYMVPGTMGQSTSAKWMESRWMRVTASIAKETCALGQLLSGSHPPLQRFSAFLKKHVWGIKSGFISKWMHNGLKEEAAAREQYLNLKAAEVSNYKVEETGFWVNSSLPELGASPDGLVLDPSESDPEGLLEIKTLKMFERFSPADITTALLEHKVTKKEIAASCFQMTEDGAITLRRSHAYYAQIQVQMLVCGKSWSDLVLHSPEGCPNIERIWRDDHYIEGLIGPIVLFWSHVMAPEIFEMRTPRQLTPFVV